MTHENLQAAGKAIAATPGLSLCKGIRFTTEAGETALVGPDGAIPPGSMVDLTDPSSILLLQHPRLRLFDVSICRYSRSGKFAVDVGFKSYTGDTIGEALANAVLCEDVRLMVANLSLDSRTINDWWFYEVSPQLVRRYGFPATANRESHLLGGRLSLCIEEHGVLLVCKESNSIARDFTSRGPCRPIMGIFGLINWLKSGYGDDHGIANSTEVGCYLEGVVREFLQSEGEQ